MAGVIIGITAIVWRIGAEKEVRTRFPEKGRFFPSRWWVLQSPLQWILGAGLSDVMLLF